MTTQETPRSMGTKRRNLLVIIGLALAAVLVGFLLVGNNSDENDGGPIYTGAFQLYDIDELITQSDAIVIGEVGEIVERVYPRQLLEEDYTDEERRILGGDAYEGSERVAFHDIHVREILKGELPDPFQIARLDVEYFKSIDLSKFEVGDEILLFIEDRTDEIEQSENPDNDPYRFVGFGDSGTFDVEDGRAYPRETLAIEGVQEEFYNREDPIRPYFEIDKLRLKIEEAIG